MDTAASGAKTAIVSPQAATAIVSPQSAGDAFARAVRTECLVRRVMSVDQLGREFVHHARLGTGIEFAALQAFVLAAFDLLHR